MNNNLMILDFGSGHREHLYSPVFEYPGLHSEQRIPLYPYAQLPFGSYSGGIIPRQAS
jgi:hypothetical protein